MTEKEIIESVKAAFGDLIDTAERSEGEDKYVLVVRKSPCCAMAIPVTCDDEDEVIEQCIENFRGAFANGLAKLIAADGDYEKAWAQ